MAVAYDNPAMFFVAAARGARQARATDLIPVDLVGIFLKEVILEERLYGERHERKWIPKGSDGKRKMLIYDV
jgi:hypothetical protein